MSQNVKKGDDFDWVSACFACSPVVAFKKLKDGIKYDVESMQSKTAGKPYGFRFDSDGDSCIAILEANRVHESVTFTLKDRVIVITDTKDKPILTAVPTIDDEGDCILRVGDKECEFWQVRKMSLNRLFFRNW